MPACVPVAVLATLVSLIVRPQGAMGQHYCWPCAKTAGVIGKHTSSSADPAACYAWLMRYLNPGGGPGYHTAFAPGLNMTVVESNDIAPHRLAVEANECGTTVGNFLQNVSAPSPELSKLVAEGLRLPTGGMHQCPCAVQGRAHIVNGSLDPALQDYSTVAAAWGPAYTAAVEQAAAARAAQAAKAFSPAETAAQARAGVFGIHAVACQFHSSGPCSLAEVDAGVSRSWAGNFSAGYQPLMDNNLMLWVRSLRPLLDALVTDGVPFLPLVWRDDATGSDRFSVLVSPCGRTLVELTAPDSGGRGAEQFKRVSMQRAVAGASNLPPRTDWAVQPVVPLRISRAVGGRMAETLEFYGAGPGGPSTAATALGFGRTRVLRDETDPVTNDRAVTLLLSAEATVHLQLWSRKNETPPLGPLPPGLEFFKATASVNQIDGRPFPLDEFCKTGVWTVDRYNTYVQDVHRTVMSSAPADPATATLYAGASFDVFIDDHFSWDCTDPSCDLEAGARALYSLGSRVQWLQVSAFGWTVYGHDPTGYGVQLHWFNMPAGFKPAGQAHPGCFGAFVANGTCPGSWT